jgi:hypothetical protein
MHVLVIPGTIDNTGEKPELLRKWIQNAENEVAGKPVECAIAYDSSGNEVLRKSGTENEITLTESEQRSLRAAVVVHNHPPGRLSNGAIVRNIPPSIKDDLDVLLTCGASEIRVVTEDYRYTLRATPDSRYPDASARLQVVRQQWTRLYNQARKRRYDALAKQYGDPLPLPLAVDFWEKIGEDAHATWVAVAPKYRLAYRREPP